MDQLQRLLDLVDQLGQFAEGSAKTSHDDILALFQRIKHSNRQVNLELENQRVQLQSQKQQSYKKSLDLQSAMYERGHLQRQIHSELGFKTSFPSPEIISAQEFVDQNPSMASLQSSDPHAFEVSRLRFELQRRVEFVALYMICL